MSARLADVSPAATECAARLTAQTVTLNKNPNQIGTSSRRTNYTEKSNMKLNTMPLTAPPAPPNEPFVPPVILGGWKNRVREELIQLESRLAKLIDFMKTDKFSALSNLHRALLTDQRYHMEEYVSILKIRLTLAD